MQVSIPYADTDKPATVDIFRAAQDARLYRIAARKLRAEARQDKASSVGAFLGLASPRKEELLRNARKCEQHARAAERAIVQAADALIAEVHQ